MRVIITGGLGHIGSRLLESRFFDEAIVVDNLSTQRYSSLFNLRRKSVTFIEKDVQKIQSKDFAKMGPIDVVIHLAAITDASGTAHLGKKVLDHNFSATENIVELCDELNIPLIFPSSTSVYGSQAQLVDEYCSELNPQSPYAESKIKEEALIQNHNSRRFKSVILRLGTISGFSTGMRFHTAVNRFCWQAANGESLTVWKTAIDQKRPYLSLDDLERALIFIIEKKLFDSKVYNIVTSNLTVRDIISFIEVSIGQEIMINYVDSPIMNQLSYEVSCERFKNLGFKFYGKIESDIHKSLELLAGLRMINRE